MGVGRGGAGRGRANPRFSYVHGTDKVEGCLMVLFFGLVFSDAPPPWKFFYRRPWMNAWSFNPFWECCHFITKLLMLRFCSFIIDWKIRIPARGFAQKFLL